MPHAGTMQIGLGQSAGPDFRDGGPAGNEVNRQSPSGPDARSSRRGSRRRRAQVQTARVKCDGLADVEIPVVPVVTTGKFPVCMRHPVIDQLLV